MPILASWIKSREEKWFNPILQARPEITVCNAARGSVDLAQINALMLTGGHDISEEFLHQPVPDPSVLEKADLPRDQWEFEAVGQALERGLPIFGICKGMQVLNVALGGTLRLDIPGHNLPAQRVHDVQPLRNDNSIKHRFEKVNSSHHQALDRLGDGCVVESWCAEDDIIEQIRVRDRPFVVGVQYHPERGPLYRPLFHDFLGLILNGHAAD